MCPPATSGKELRAISFCLCKKKWQKKKHTRRHSIGIYSLSRGCFSAILRYQSSAGVSLAELRYLVYQKNISLGSALQF